MTVTTRAWLHGLGAAFVGSFATAAAGALVLPDVFNLSSGGLLNLGKLTLVPAAVAVFAYLRQSPLPALSVTETTTSSKTTEVTSNTE